MNTGAAAPAIGAGRDPAAFVRANTMLESPRLLPELKLHVASEVVPLWEATQEELTAQGLPPPYWAFAWAGGQALARYILDTPESVLGRRVLDFATGSGMVALAARKAGAARVEASEIDPFACAAVTLNAEANALAVELLREDVLKRSLCPWQVILAGDICYETPMAERAIAWLRAAAGAGATVIIGDPGRNYLPASGLEKLATYTVPTTREMEDSELRETSVWRVLPNA